MQIKTVQCKYIESKCREKQERSGNMKRRRRFLIISFWRSFAFSLLWISVQLTDIRKEMQTERLKVCAYKTCVQHHLYISIDLHWIPFLFICLVHHSFVLVFALPFRYFSVPFFIFRWDMTRMNVKIGIILLKVYRSNQTWIFPASRN